MSKGGEKLESVIGRGEDEELPNFEAGAFEIEVNDRLRNGKRLVDEKFLNNYVQEGAIDRHTMHGLVNFIRLADATEFTCSEPTQYPTSEELSIGKIKFKAFDLGGHRLHAQFGRLLCQGDLLTPVSRLWYLGQFSSHERVEGFAGATIYSH